MNATPSKFHIHAECNLCEHGRNCINGKYCLAHKMYVHHIELLPCKKNNQ
nr:MAG TPA: hypothetical protein [Caudoviricetes sp.]